MAGLHPTLRLLLVKQQSVRVGAPGGLHAQLDPAALEALQVEARYARPVMAKTFSKGPDERRACEEVVPFVEFLVQVLVASRYYLVELEEKALLFCHNQLSGRASEIWRLCAKEAARTATTSGIGPNSVLYRTLRDWLHEYPPTGIKDDILEREKVEFVWNPKATAAANLSAWAAFFEIWDNAVDLTATLTVALRVPPQDWTTRLSNMQARFPAWISTLIADHPERFDSMVNLRTRILEAAAHRFRAGKGGLHSLAAQEDEMLQAGVGGNDFYDGIFALTRGCWRCGKTGHRRDDCPLPQSDAERRGEPLRRWAVDATPDARAVSQLSSIQAHMAKQDQALAAMSSMVRQLTAGGSIAAAPPPVAGPLVASIPTTGPPDLRTLNLAALTNDADLPPNIPEPCDAGAPDVAPMIMGGPQPAGYVFAGQNQGLPLWVTPSIIEASVMMAPSENGAGSSE